MGMKSNSYWFLVEIAEGKRPFGRSRCRCDDEVKMDLKEIGWEGVDWIYVAQ
jgi:hypothetical protein